MGIEKSVTAAGLMSDVIAREEPFPVPAPGATKRDAMTIFTVSYEGRSLKDFLADLRKHGVRLVADVREAPISRKRGFSKTSLSQALETAGIAYRHFRALGCPKVIRVAYREDSDWARYTRAYMKHLRLQQPAVEELAAVTNAQPTALLCFEADFTRCHRTYVARAVAAHAGSTVCHITAAGLVEDAPLPAALIK